MGKKRRVWWFVGVVVALTAAIFIVIYNSTDARIERAVAQIVEEYGFEMTFRSRGARPGRLTSYERAPVDEQTADEIVAKLQTACPSFEYSELLLSEEPFNVTKSDGSPGVVQRGFIAPEGDRSSIMEISFMPDWKTSGSPNAGSAVLSVSKKSDGRSPWEGIKGLWPW